VQPNYITTILRSEMYYGLSAPKLRNVRGSTRQTPQNHQCFWRIFYTGWRTVRSPLADCPQYTYAKPPDTTASLDKFLILSADRLQLSNSGPSAVQFCETTRDNSVSGQISNPTGGPSGPPWRTVRSSLFQSTRDDNVSGQNSRLYGGLSALQ